MRYNLPYLFYLYLPKILAIIFIPIIKWKSGDDSHELNDSTKQYHIAPVKTKNKRVFLLIYIISLLEVIQENGDLLVYYYGRVGYIKWLVDKKSLLIIFIPLLCCLILKSNLFKHHILALILGLIGTFIFNFCRFTLGFSTIEDYPFHLLYIFFSFILSLAFVLIKYFMIRFVMISPYLFLFYNGIFNILNSFIWILLEYFLVTNLPEPELFEKNERNYFYNNYVEIFTFFIGKGKEFYIYFCLMLILLFAYYTLNALTIYNFNLYLIIIVETSIPIDTDLIEIFYRTVFLPGKILTRVLFQTIGYIIIMIAALILNEIIILNFLGFNKNISSSNELDGEGSLTLIQDSKGNTENKSDSDSEN